LASVRENTDHSAKDGRMLTAADFKRRIVRIKAFGDNRH
jgi:hypothetical protein